MSGLEIEGAFWDRAGESLVGTRLLHALVVIEIDVKLKDFEKGRLPMLEGSAEPDRFWGALWLVTKAVSMPRPEYPQAAKGRCERILVEVVLNEEGRVIRAQSMCGRSALLINVSEAAAKQSCTSGGIPHHNLSETAYWGTVGLLGFMFLGLAVPSTLFVILIMSLLILSGLNWKKVIFLWPVGFLLWGVYWVFLAYAVCTASD